MHTNTHSFDNSKLQCSWEKMKLVYNQKHYQITLVRNAELCVDIQPLAAGRLLFSSKMQPYCTIPMRSCSENMQQSKF